MAQDAVNRLAGGASFNHRINSGLLLGRERPVRLHHEVGQRKTDDFGNQETRIEKWIGDPCRLQPLAGRGKFTCDSGPGRRAQCCSPSCASCPA